MCVIKEFEMKDIHDFDHTLWSANVEFPTSTGRSLETSVRGLRKF